MTDDRTGTAYVHGYTEREGERLRDQADTLARLLHADTHYPPGSLVLEAGCGVGAQTVLLATQSPGARIVSFDHSATSVNQARATARAAGLDNVTFLVGDLFRPPWPPASFDHVFVCFVLEHLPEPERALRTLVPLLRPGGTLTAIEGDHGSAFFHPDDADARRAVECLVEAQAGCGGDANIGRRLYPLLTGAGLADVRVTPRAVYADASRPVLVEGFIEKTFTAMVAGARDDVLARGLTDAATWERGIAGLRRTAEPDGSFFYCFFKGVGVRPADARSVVD
jgi:SAM-dependent methyltransferase